MKTTPAAALLAVILLATTGATQATTTTSTCDYQRFHGLAFSPYGPGQAPGTPLPEEQIAQRLELVAPWVQWIRTYGAWGGLETIPGKARDLGLKVAMGTWLRHNQAAELDNLIIAAQQDQVDIAIVGNEELYAYECGDEPHLTPTEYLAVIHEVRRRLDAVGQEDIPVAIAEPWTILTERDAGGLLTYAGHIAACDVVFANIFPYHQGAHIEEAIATLSNAYDEVVAAVDGVSPGKQVVIGETGWPDAGETKGSAVPSESNQRRYFFLSTGWAHRNGIKLFYFEAFDEDWKGILGPEYEAHWGLWDANAQPKFSLNPKSPVYRFWSPLHSHHFYTIDEREKNGIIDIYPPSTWTFEGTAYCAYPEGAQGAIASPVYRFWSPEHSSHFYTINIDERDSIIATYPPSTWTYEGTAFYAYSEGDQPAGTSPVHRFWSPLHGGHFFTISEAEKDWIIDRYPLCVWTYEGIGWYAYPP